MPHLEENTQNHTATPMAHALGEIECRLAFMMQAATADDINPAYLENLERCHALALGAITA